MPEISIIIPAHNEGKCIERILNSVKDSDYKNYEIVVICDSCSDDTEKISKKFTKRVYKVKFKNTSKNRNFGAKKAKGKILVFLDADTKISKSYLQMIKKSVDKGAQYGTAKWVNETNSLFGKYWAWGNNRANKRSKTISGNCFVTKEVFEKVRGFDETMKKGEDTDLGDRLRQNNKNYIFIEDTYYIPSERKYEKSWFNFWTKAILESWLYKLSKKSYKKKFSH